jgi:hypothetical protein
MDENEVDLKLQKLLFDTLPPMSTIGRVKMLATQIKEEISSEWEAMRQTANHLN